jgi:hypothetical protein
MATIIDSLLVKLGLDSSEFKSGKNDVDAGLKDTSKKADKTAESFEVVAKKAAKFLAVLGGTMAVKHFIQNQIESNAALARLSKNLGEGADEISAWSRAAELAGGSSSGLQGTMDSLSQSQTELMLTGQSGLIPYFSALGISMADAGGKARPVSAMLLDLADKFGKMDRTTANNMGRMMGIDQGTMQLLLKGRSEVEMMIRRQKEHGAVTKKQAEDSLRLNQIMIASRQGFETFGRTLLSVAMPALEALGNLFADFGNWASSNMEFIQGFLTVIAGGLAAIAVASMPINLTVLAVVALAAALVALWQDYQTFKRGGDTLIDWKKWGPGIEAAKTGLGFLKDLLIDMLVRAVAVGDAILKLATGDFSGAMIAAKAVLFGVEGVGLQSNDGGGAPASSPVAGIPGASRSAAGAGASNGVQARLAGAPQAGNRTVTTTIGEINVTTAATDAKGVADGMGKSMDYLFTSQANLGMN